MFGKLLYSDKFKSVLDQIQTQNNILDIFKAIQDIDLCVDFNCIDISSNCNTVRIIDSIKLSKWFKKHQTKAYKGDFNLYLNDINDGFHPERLNDREHKYPMRLSHLSQDDFNVGSIEIKIGRLVSKILNIDIPIIKDYLRKPPRLISEDIEDFVNLFRVSISKKYYFFELVKGDEIRDCYFYKNYSITKGTLGNSCMRHSSCQDYFDIYTKNPDICQLLVLRYKNNPKLVAGRAIMWTLTNGQKFMDVAYCTNEQDWYLFVEKAKELGATTRYKNSGIVKVQLHNFKHKNKSKILPFLFKGTKYPYLDTLIYLNKRTNILTNQKPSYYDRNLKDWIMLQSTQGQYNTF